MTHDITLRIKESQMCKIGRLTEKINVNAPGRGVLPYMGYIGMCGPKGYGFSAVLVINWVSILAILSPFWS